MKSVIFFALALGFASPAFADQPVLGQIGAPVVHPVSSTQIVYSNFYLTLASGSVRGINQRVRFSADQATADFLCRKFSSIPSAHAAKRIVADFSGQGPIVKIDAQGEMMGSHSGEYLDWIECGN